MDPNNLRRNLAGRNGTLRTIKGKGVRKMSKKKMAYDDFDNRNYAKWTDVVNPVVATIEEVRFEEMPNAKINKRTGEKQLTIVLYFTEEQFRFGVPLSAKVNRRALASI